MIDLSSLASIDTGLDCRAITFENPTGARGAGGTAGRGRKGSPSRHLAAGERVVLADIEGPGVVRHVWMTFPPAPPEVMRAITMDVFYNGAAEPSVSVPCLDFFGMPHGRPVSYSSALASAQEGRGFNAYFPMPFREHLRVELTNHSSRPIDLYYQFDLTLEAAVDSHLHIAFRRQNPTVMGEDFLIAGGLDGPGRFAGCNVGVRVLDGIGWYGEGELKVYRDGDTDLPTICGTGLEDYVGSAWGMGPHAALYAGAPLVVGPAASNPLMKADFVGFYRWHLLDPIIFTDSLRVTIQQIGMMLFPRGSEAEFEQWADTHPAAGNGWQRPEEGPIHALGIHERSDDYCATSYVYCREAQPVPRVDVAAAIADIGRTPDETPGVVEQLFGALPS